MRKTKNYLKKLQMTLRNHIQISQKKGKKKDSGAAQKTSPAISPELWLQFSQTGPHFLQNHSMKPIKL